MAAPEDAHEGGAECTDLSLAFVRFARRKAALRMTSLSIGSTTAASENLFQTDPLPDD